MKVLFIDAVHPVIAEKMQEKGWQCDFRYNDLREDILQYISEYDGLILRSRTQLDRSFLSQARRLQFIGRPGAGLENIDLEFCNNNSIKVFRSPEGNCDAVAEHAIGMLLALMNNLLQADAEVRKGNWFREENRGYEIKGKTIGIIGYGYMGKAFARVLRGFNVTVLAYDKYLKGFGNEYVQEVDLNTLKQQSDIVSLHTPLTHETRGMIHYDFLKSFSKAFYFINTARGKSVVTKDLLLAIREGIVKGACLDVLEHEGSSFEDLVTTHPDFQALITNKKVILSPHIAGWTFEAKQKMGEYLVEKILHHFH